MATTATTPKAAHTPGRLRFMVHGSLAKDEVTILAGGVQALDRVVVASVKAWQRDELDDVVYRGFRETLGNAQRLVACWNALEGLNPEAVPDLLAACEAVIESVDWEANHYDEPPQRPVEVTALDALEAAIAKARGA